MQKSCLRFSSIKRRSTYTPNQQQNDHRPIVHIVEYILLAKPHIFFAILCVFLIIVFREVLK